MNYWVINVITANFSSIYHEIYCNYYELLRICFELFSIYHEMFSNYELFGMCCE